MNVLKLIGAILIVVAGAMIGHLKARKLADRPAQIRRFIRVLQQLETEISYGFTPLPEAMHKLALQTTEPLSTMFSVVSSNLQSPLGLSVKESWDQAILERWSYTAMQEGEQDIIVQLGSSLGTTDREDQLKHLRLASSQLGSMESEAAEEQRRFEKMWRSLGVLGGALIVVMMY
jgi:stage III sporulation protein AB